MSAREPRWEIVRTAAGWHARFIARNNRVVVSTEVYTRKQSAIHGIRVVQFDSPNREIREVDERGSDD